MISLREIGEGKVSIKTLEDSAINKLRKQQDKTSEIEELEEEDEDNFDKIYKGEVSKSGTAILPSKRVRRIPEKLNVKEDSDKVLDLAKDKDINDKSSEDDTPIEEKKSEK